MAQHGVGDLTDPELKRGTVFHETRDVTPDRRGDLAFVRLRGFQDRITAGHERGEVANVDEAVAERPGGL